MTEPETGTEHEELPLVEAVAEPLSPEEVHDGVGHLPPWRKAELPAPPPFKVRNLPQLVGPGVIALGVGIGTGEWLIGPAVISKYGAGLLWVATTAILLQVILNQEVVRYTMYTGEPIYSGFMRTRPGPLYWGWIYSMLLFLQIGWSGFALTSASAIGGIVLGRLPDEGDRTLLILIGSGIIVGTVILIAIGQKVVETLQRAQLAMVLFIAAYLALIAILFVPVGTWGDAMVGFVSFGNLPSGGDWFLLAAFGAAAGMQGLNNATVSNWARDEGYGMGKVVGFIPGATAHEDGHIGLSHTGAVFDVTPESKRRWREYWKFLWVDQGLVFGVGVFLGNLIPAIVVLGFVPRGTNFNGLDVAAITGDFIGSAHGRAYFYLTLLAGFFIFYTTQLGLTDIFPRTVTDILWTASPRVRRARGGDVRWVYYSALVLFAIWGLITIHLGSPLFLAKVALTVAAFNYVFLAAHTLYTNRKLLPKELRPPLWRELVLVFCCLNFGFYGVLAVLDQFLGVSL